MPQNPLRGYAYSRSPHQGAGKLTPLLTATHGGRTGCRGGRDVSLPPSVPVPGVVGVACAQSEPHPVARVCSLVGKAGESLIVYLSEER